VDEYDRRALSDDDGVHARPYDIAPDALHNECFWFAGQFADIRHFRRPSRPYARRASSDRGDAGLDSVRFRSANVVKKVIVAAPRGFCAGVVRAVETVERALSMYGPPVYVRHQIVHNSHVVRDLERRGAVFVDSAEDVPEGAVLVLAAHGVAPTVYSKADSRSLQTIDATCPLVTKVHGETRRFADEGYRVILIGHAGHDEVVGTMGQAPEATVLVETAQQARALELREAERIAYVTQTTLSLDETAEIIAVLRARFPSIVGPRKEDICYATTNRQNAVKSLLGQVDVVLVVGSRESSNSNRLVETARAAGVAAHLVEDRNQLEERWFDGFETVGITAGASTPEQLVQGVLAWFRARRVTDIRSSAASDEDVSFKLPRELAAPPVRRASLALT
jgi:4-hydroxy-3-methylbut-2-enyl diphosphate reductase